MASKDVKANVNRLGLQIATRRAMDPRETFPVEVTNKQGEKVTVKRGKRVAWIKGNTFKGYYFVNIVTHSKYSPGISRLGLVPVDEELRKRDNEGRLEVQWANHYECLVTSPHAYIRFTTADLKEAEEVKDTE